MQKRGRPSKQTASKDKSAGRKSTRTRNQEADEDATSRREAPPLKRKRNVREVEDEELDEIAADAPAASAATSAPVRPKYVSLVPKTRRLPQATIEKWPLVSAPVVEQIRILLGHAKDAVALSRRDSQKQAEADELLNGVIHQLGRHFSVMKVPPRAKAQHFDIDQLTTRNERLLYALTTERDKNKLLKDKTEKTQAQLSSEEETLNATKANAQSWQRAWKSQEKKQVSDMSSYSSLASYSVPLASSSVARLRGRGIGNRQT